MQNHPHRAQPSRHRAWASISLVLILAVMWASPSWSQDADAPAAPSASESSSEVPKEAPKEEVVDQIFDAVALRPLGAMSAFLGMLGFAVTTPFTVIDMKLDESWEFFVQPAVDFTFSRRLGDI